MKEQTKRMDNQTKELKYKDIALYLPSILKILWTKEDGKNLIVETRTASGGAFYHLHNSRPIPFVSAMPLLRPMSDMTEEEVNEFHALNEFIVINKGETNINSPSWTDEIHIEDAFILCQFYASKGLDFQDLIGQGKALNIKDYTK